MAVGQKRSMDFKIPMQKSAAGPALLGIEVLLWALLAWLIFKFVMIFAGSGLTTGIAAAPIDDLPPQTQSSPQTYLSILTGFDPFFRNEQEIIIPDAVLESAPETTLNLKVFGMRAHIDGDNSSAIIQTPDGKQAAYIIGAEIIPGVTLQSVDVDFVILDRNGTAERLSRQGKTKEEHSAGNSSLVAGVPDTLAYAAKDLFNDISFRMRRDGRNVLGYQVIAKSGGNAKLKSYGFESGDIVTSINGYSMTQGRVNMLDLIKNVKKARYASIQIIRDDIPMTLDVNLQ